MELSHTVTGHLFKPLAWRQFLKFLKHHLRTCGLLFRHLSLRVNDQMNEQKAFLPGWLLQDQTTTLIPTNYCFPSLLPIISHNLCFSSLSITAAAPASGAGDLRPPASDPP